MDYSSYETMVVERKGRILRLTLNRPDSLNSVNAKMHTELSTIFSDIRRDDETHVVTITGAGRAFCAGGDREALASLDAHSTRRLFVEAREILVQILELDKPIIAGVNGPAAGFGATLALFCDIVIASERARIGDTHVNMGLSAGDGGAVIWPILVGVNKAKELLMTGDLIDAEEGHRLGLFNHVIEHERLDDAVMAMAQRLASGPTTAIRYSKRPVNHYIRWMLNQVFDLSCSLEYVAALEMQLPGDTAPTANKS